MLKPLLLLPFFCVATQALSLPPVEVENPVKVSVDGGGGTLPSLVVPRTSTAPVIDGNTSDAVWRKAAVISGLLPALKVTAKEDLAIQATTVRVLWDEQNLYVAFDCIDDDVFSTGTMKHDDDIYKEDVCEVFLDGKGDGRQYVEIQVSPTGINLDLMYLLTAAAEQGPDLRLSSRVMKTERWCFREWEMPGLQTAAKKTDHGWSAEFAIPAEPIMKRLGYSVYRPGLIHAHFMRYDWMRGDGRQERRLVQQNWSPVLTGNPHNTPALMGRLMLTNAPCL